MVVPLASRTGDVVVRQERRDGVRLYILHTTAARDQYLVHTREEAIAQALKYAKRQRVRAWLTDEEHDVVLLGDFREMPSLPVSSVGSS